jgi:hypothetical protein
LSHATHHCFCGGFSAVCWILVTCIQVGGIGEGRPAILQVMVIPTYHTAGKIILQQLDSPEPFFLGL